MAYRDYSTALGRIVDSSGKGDFTTIAAATAAASSGQTIFIHSGTYTENFSPKDGVSYVAFSTSTNAPIVKIIGKMSFSSAVSASFKGIYFQTNSDNIVAITGTSNVLIDFESCYFNASNATAFSCTASAGTQSIIIKSCTGDLGTTGITWFTFTRGGITMRDSSLGNGAQSTTASTLSNSSAISFRNCTFQSPITTSDSASVGFTDVVMRLGGGYNLTCLTLNGAGTVDIEFCLLESGTASVISVGSGVVAEVYECTIDSSNTNAITGAGTLRYGGLIFTGTSNTMNTTTQTARVNRPGITRSSHQPAFLAIGGAVNNVTGNSGTYSLGASAVMTEIFDQNGDFTVGNGAGTAATFTAPYTGKYFLEINIRTSGYVASTNANYRIVTTARTYLGYAFHPLNVQSSGAGVIGGFSVLADMTAGDTATFGFSATGEASNVCDVVDSFVSGYLVC